MKKLFFLFTVIAMTLVSCSSEDGPKMEQQKTMVPLSATLTEIQHYNDSLMTCHIDASRGWLTKALQVCSIAGADALGIWQGAKMGGTIGAVAGPQGAAVGATVGGLICGAGASYVAYRTVRSDQTPDFNLLASAYVAINSDIVDYKAYRPAIKVDVPEGQTDFYEIGAKHNAMLNKLLSGSISQNSPENVLTPEELEIISNQAFKSQYYELLDNFEYGNNLSLLPKELSEADNVIKAYVTILKRAPDDKVKIAQITSNYIKIVNRSESLSQDEKDRLVSCMLAAVSSYEYWDQKKEPSFQ